MRLPSHPRSHPCVLLLLLCSSSPPPLFFPPPACICSCSGHQRQTAWIHRAPRESAMSAGSSSSAQKVGPLRLAPQTHLPLVPCPKCGEEILELTSGPGSKVPGAIFFKCRFHDRDDPTSCPWYLFADKYEKLLIGKGLVEMRGSAGKCIRQEEALEANKAELTPLLADAVSLNNGRDSVAEKLQKLVDIGKIVAVSLIVVAVVLVLGVITMFFK